METLNEVLVECIRAAGGSKVIGPLLWPEKSPEAAQRLLLDCMNEDRAAKLSPEQVLFVLRRARQHGHHGGINYLAAQAGYSAPQPIEPRDEEAELKRQYIEATRTIARIAQRIEAVTQDNR